MTVVVVVADLALLTGELVTPMEAGVAVAAGAGCVRGNPAGMDTVVFSN